MPPSLDGMEGICSVVCPRYAQSSSCMTCLPSHSTSRCEAHPTQSLGAEPYLWAVAQARAQLELMKRACTELEACDDFVTLLQEVLKTGNRLN